MFHMLACFNLRPEFPVDEFRRSVEDLTRYLQETELVDSTSAIGRRQSDTIMDTDSERSQEYFFIMSFRDRAQCDAAAEHISQREEPGVSIHDGVYSKITNPIFTCWEDI